MVHAVPVGPPAWRTGRYTVITLPAQIDVANADEVREQLLTALNAEGSAVSPLIVDLSDTTFCDSSGVNALLRVNIRTVAMGRRMYLAVRPGGLVRKVFDITAVPRLIPTADDLGAAIAMAVVAALDDASASETGKCADKGEAP
jgi:anti-sigma B factor antagonist